MSWPWNELGLPGPSGLPEIRRAYAQRLKTTHPEEDPEGFQRLHTAYQEASRYARQAGSARRTARAAQAEQPPVKPAPESSRRAARETGFQETEEPKAAPSCGQPPPKGKDWDYDELLAGQEAPKESPEDSKSGEPAWNYEELLEEEADRPENQPEDAGAGWDYERLFAEGEAEAQEIRRRKLEELRRKNRARYAAQEQEQRRRVSDDEEAWAAVMAAAHALELLHSSGAPMPQWRRFLNDPLFWNVRANLDFVFALEDFLERHPDLSPDIRRAIFAAYGFEKGPGNPVYKRLCRLLNVDRKEKRRMSRAKSRWRASWRSYPPWRKAVIVVCFTILAVFFFIGWAVNLRTAYHDFMDRKAEEQWETHILDWLEEDYGEPFFLAVRDNIYAPESDPTLYFWVTRDGERTEDWPGYRTDYPHILVKQAMEDFSEKRDLGLKLDSAGGGFREDIGNAPGAYLFDLPLRGAEDAISALGELVDKLKAQDWYRIPEDKYGCRIEYQIFLCHRDLSFYDAISTEDGGFDTEEALSRYETAGPAFCRYILEHSGLIEKHMGGNEYLLLDRGTAELDGSSLFLVTALDKESQEPKAHYFLGGGTLFCLPEGDLEKVERMADLYRGSISHLQLDGVGLVMVMDQIGTA